MSRRQQIHATLSEHFIPETGVFGDVWLAKAEQSFWYATRDGRVVNLSDVLNQVPVHTPPRHGKDGKDGISIKGEPGRDAVGIQGPPGRDAVGIQGPPGINVKGERGDIGPRGFPGPDTAAVLADARAEIAALRSEFANLSLQVLAIREANTHAANYIEFLKAKVESRKQ
jgi:hypothetical protein